MHTTLALLAVFAVLVPLSKQLDINRLILQQDQPVIYSLPPGGWKICRSLNTTCTTGTECCSKNCANDRCCGREGATGCVIGQGYDGAGGCCLKHHCEYNEILKRNECRQTIYK